MNDFIRPINYVKEKKKPKIDIKQVFKSAWLVLEIKETAKIEDTLITISNSKLRAFNARINFMKRTNQHEKIDMFDLAGQSKRRLTVFPRGSKYEKHG